MEDDQHSAAVSRLQDRRDAAYEQGRREEGEFVFSGEAHRLGDDHKIDEIDENDRGMLECKDGNAERRWSFLIGELQIRWSGCHAVPQSMKKRRKRRR